MKPLNLSADAPWRERFEAPAFLMTQVARLDSTRGTAVSNESGIYQVYAWDVETNERRQLTHRAEGVIMHWLSPDGRYIYYLQDKQGNEIGHFVRLPWNIEVAESSEPEVVTPTIPPYSPGGLSISRLGNKLAFVTAMPDGFTLYVIDLQDDQIGEPRKLFHGQALMRGVQLSADGKLVLVHSTEPTDSMESALYVFDAESGEKVSELWDGAKTGMSAFGFIPLAGDGRLLANSSKTGTERLFIWDPTTGERWDLPIDHTGSAVGNGWSSDGKRVLFSLLEQAQQKLNTFDLVTEETAVLDTPNGTKAAPYFMPNGEIFVLLTESAHPGRLIALDDQTGQFKRVVLEASEIAPGKSWRSINYNSTDEHQVQGWLALPDDVSGNGGPFPTILNMIGGPMGVKVNSFSAASQAWLDHGFAYLSINYRGCSTFGREHQYKIIGDLGHWEVEDMVGARNWLVEQGIAIPEQIFLDGRSYGGYLTLMGLGKYPDLWVGGMAGVAIADWAVQYEDTADMLRGVQESLFGGTPQEYPERYAKSSPITYAEQVKAPVLIIQGRNDTRTPARPIEMYEAKMRALGKDIRVEWYDTGHSGGYADSKLAVQHMEMNLKFAYHVLGELDN